MTDTRGRVPTLGDLYRGHEAGSTRSMVLDLTGDFLILLPLIGL